MASKPDSKRGKGKRKNGRSKAARPAIAKRRASDELVPDFGVLEASVDRRALATQLMISSKDSAVLEARTWELEQELADLRVELERSERRVEAMKQIGRILGSNLSLDPLLTELVGRTTELLEADRSTLFLVDLETRELWSKVLEADEFREIRLDRGTGLAGWVAEHGSPLHIDDAYRDPRFDPSFDKKSGYQTREVLVWPIRRPTSHEVIGVIQVLNKRSGSFAPTDERLLEAIASEIGVAIEVATLYREALERSLALERAQRELRLLFDTERAISESAELSEMIERIVTTALSAFDAKVGIVYVLDERGLGLEVLSAVGVSWSAAERRAKNRGGGVIASVIKSGQSICRSNISNQRIGRAGLRNLATVPIRTRYDGTIGVFELINKKGGAELDALEVEALSMVAGQAGRAIRADRRRAQREQSERLTAIGQMLSGVVHDLRTPMTLISGYTQIMALCEVSDDRARYAHQVNKQIDILSSMTKDLLAFARGERNVLIRKVYVKRFMQEMEEYLDKEFADTGVKLEVDISYTGAARFDENKMRRVFHNIARNAREAMPGGGRFKIAALKRGNHLVFRFTDTGGGIPAALQDRVFEPFATAGKVGGTGLGLAMVQQIAEEHRGEITYTTSRRGTTFTFRFPLRTS